MSFPKISNTQMVFFIELAEKCGPVVWKILRILLGKEVPEPDSDERKRLLDDAKAAQARWHAAEPPTD